jgi:hypothetical protein
VRSAERHDAASQPDWRNVLLVSDNAPTLVAT